MISAIIPNFNYSRFLKTRLTTVINQSVKPSEIIFLDDASTDDSVQVAKRILSASDIPYHIIENQVNSGRVFDQWQKGFELARGEFLWIAEADDAASPRFLERVSAPMERNSRIGLAYTETAAINDRGRISDLNFYRRKHKRLDARKWRRDYEEKGIVEVGGYLSSYNTIPNASGVLIRRGAIEKAGGFARGYRLSGDWASYINILEHYDIAYVSAVLNYQRFHPSRLTGKLDKTLLQCQEALEIFQSALNRFEITPQGKTNFLGTLYLWLESGRIPGEEKSLFWADVKELMGADFFDGTDWDVFKTFLPQKTRRGNVSLEKLYAKTRLRHIR